MKNAKSRRRAKRRRRPDHAAPQRETIEPSVKARVTARALARPPRARWRKPRASVAPRIPWRSSDCGQGRRRWCGQTCVRQASEPCTDHRYARSSAKGSRHGHIRGGVMKPIWILVEQTPFAKAAKPEHCRFPRRRASPAPYGRRAKRCCAQHYSRGAAQGEHRGGNR
jgi:hypothetical protein